MVFYNNIVRHEMNAFALLKFRVRQLVLSGTNAKIKVGITK